MKQSRVGRKSDSALRLLRSHDRKYVIFGKSMDGDEAEVVAKIVGTVVIITVYLI